MLAEVRDGEPAATFCDHPRARLEPHFQARDYISGETFLVGLCHDCGLHITWPAPAEEALPSYYPRSYYAEGRRFNSFVERLLDGLYSYRAWHIEQRQAPGKVLDVGCGRGLLMAKLRQRGWETVGTELTDDAAAHARSLGLDVHTGTLEEIGFRDAEFDMVILWHVLEHVPAPRAMLQEVSRILKPGGTLLVAVPNFASREARMSGPGWFHLDVPRHLTHFTPRTLRHVLDQAGLPVFDVNFFSTEYDFFSFVQSTQNRLGLPQNLLYDMLRTRQAKVARHGGSSATAAQKAAALLSAPLLGLAGMVLAPLAAAFGRGATIAAYARKRD
jgi:SAM-dependent methyltransferase